MSRECRRVPADWEHPILPGEFYRDGTQAYQPMFDEPIETAFPEWLAEFDRIRDGNLDEWEVDLYDGPNGLAQWCAENPPPDVRYYRPNWPDEIRTHYQMYETTTEGTPKSPPFATPEECARWCADNGVSAFAGRTASYEQWLLIARGTPSVGSMVITADGQMLSGVEAASIGNG